MRPSVPSKELEKRRRKAIETVIKDKMSGAPRKLTDKDLKHLEKMILKGAKAQGFANDLWTCARIAELVKREFGVDYHFNHVGKILARMGWSPQRPEKRAIGRDERRIKSWVKTEFPRIKKKPGG